MVRIHLLWRPVACALLMTWGTQVPNLLRAQSAGNGGVEVEYPFNPDANDDGAVGTTDLLSILDLYGGAFDPSALMVSGMELGVYLGLLEDALDAISAAVGASQASSLPAGTGLTPGTVMMWSGTVWQPVRIAGCKDYAYACNYDPAAYLHVSEMCDYFPECPAVDPSATGPCQGQPTVAYGGTEYELIEFGSKCWFRENLATTTYRNGTAIPTGLSDSAWSTTTGGAYAAVAGGACSECGLLYNGHAVSASAGLCPMGFHVATDADWTALEAFIGGATSGGRLIKVGPSASSLGWDGTDASGFSGYPSGYRNDLNGISLNYGNQGMWWTSTSSSGQLWYRQLYTGSDGIQRNLYPKNAGYSVRCVKDWP